MFGYVPEFRMDESDILHCPRRDEPHHLSGYCNPQVDRLLDTLPRIVDRRAAKPRWVQYQRGIAADQPFTLLYFQQRREGVSNRLRNVDPDTRSDLV
jgi:ABC-type transport system substrate-binding protein